MRVSVAMAVAWLSISVLSAAEPAQAAMRKSTDIPAQGLGSALQTFAKQRALQLVYLSDAVDALSTRGASGELTSDEALQQLLSGTGLTYRYLDESTVTVFPADAPAAMSGSTGGVESQIAGAEPVGNTAAQEADGGSKRGAFWSRRVAQSDETQATENKTADGDPSPPDASGDSEKLDEIVVTAQKRLERLQDVPISITVLTGAELDKASTPGVTEALRGVPGVTATVAQFGGITQIAVRGVAAPVGSSTVSYYLDTIPFGFVRSSWAPDAAAFDLERVEVLRGPQGTLYGSTAQNGVVRVLTKDVDLDRFEAKARTTISTTKIGGENYRGDAAINVPLVEGKLAMRAVAGYSDYSGWLDKSNQQDANDTEVKTLRFKIGAQPTDALSLGVQAWLSRTYMGAYSTGLVNGTAAPLNPEPVDADYDAFGFNLGYDFSFATFLATTSYLDYKNHNLIDYGPGTFNIAGNILDTHLDSEILTQDLGLTGTSDGAWRWSLGASYRHGRDRTDQFRQAYTRRNTWEDLSSSYTVFGEITRELLDGAFEITGGLRYFHDEARYTEISRLSVVAPPPAYVPIVSEPQFEKVSPRVVLTWHSSQNTTVYASYGEGFRSGFSQQGSALAQNPQVDEVESDNLKNYEIGSKGNLLGGKLAYDVAAYYIDWQGVQQSIQANLGTATTPIFGAITVNGPAASGPGFEAALTAEPMAGLVLGASFAVNDLTLDGNVVSGAASTLIFAKGDRLNGSAKHTFGASADYTVPVGNNYDLSLSASGNYTSSQEMRTAVTTVTPGDAMFIARAAATLESGTNWSAMLFVDNLNNETGAPIKSAFGVRNWDVRIRPRTVGLQFDYRF